LTAARSSDTIARVRVQLALFGASIVLAIACGARSGLDLSEPARAHADAGSEIVDAPPDVVDAPPDVPIVDECQDAGTTYIYLITVDNELYRFYPPDLQSGTPFHDLGPLKCPIAKGDSPYSMAVDRKGTAYCIFQSGDLFLFSTGNPAACNATSYVPTTIGANFTFGMGFSANVNDPGETLYVASNDPPVAGPPKPEFLGSIDVQTFTLSTIGQFQKVIGSAELTGTSDGRLFGFGVNEPSVSGPASYQLIEFDKQKAKILTDIPLMMPSGSLGVHGWAFAYWGGDFYFFTSDITMGGQTGVSLYHPQPGDTLAVAHWVGIVPKTIVGAGVSTCAP
jgi:hypothetical protein